MTHTTATIDDLERRARTASTSLADGQRLSDEAQRLRGVTPRRSTSRATVLLRN